MVSRIVSLLFGLVGYLVAQVRLLFALVTSAYIYFEEQAMVDRFGERCKQYRTDTPMLIPGIKEG